MTAPAKDLSALISSRICHDLINPIGAISNGIELLEEIGKGQGPELELVAQSVASANAKLNYFRIAFGDAAAEAEIRTALLERQIGAMFETTRLKVQCSFLGDATRRRGARVALLSLLCAESALPLGGAVAFDETETGWSIAADSARVKLEPRLWQTLTEGASDDGIGSSDVEFAAVAHALSDYGMKLDFAPRETGFDLTIRVG